MIRRFLYMVDIFDKAGYGPQPYRLRRINPSHLFFPKDALPVPQSSSAATVVEDLPLPPTEITFCGSTEFMRRSDDKIVGVDRTTRRAILYDPAEHSGSTVGPSFEALIHRDRRPLNGGRLEDECYWRPLPPPPCVHAAGYRGSSGEIRGYAVVGDAHILVSTQSYGTYSFATANTAWSKAGDWALPFCGRAEYVPEHGLWFGLSAANDDVFGAWDLSSTVQQQPVVAHRGCKGFAVLETPYASYVVHLGDGKLCIAKLFMVARRETCSESWCDFDRDRRFCTMLTGVEVVRCNGDKLHIIKHRSCRYSFGEHYIPTYVL
ncbi:hypothetical protein OsJ_05352 [Oryza sativa Japonica Group]|uniref:Uncharacterized protein n=1 Tax=Oryza sativa subsp. japonica TaxID=39947 RepID=B9F2P2_ORYSJ|nr:hypothetical protein OsJ_05352 [Oryza sativa Japonica Group]